MIILCCTDNMSSIAPLMGADGGYRRIRIGVDGQVEVLDKADKPCTLYFSQLQFAGAVEPDSKNPGLDLVPDCIVYNGLAMDFLAAFAHYRSHVGLHAYKALYLERDSILVRYEREMKIGGKGHVNTIEAKSSALPEKEFKIEQFAPGESWPVSAKSGWLASNGNGPGTLPNSQGLS